MYGFHAAGPQAVCELLQVNWALVMTTGCPMQVCSCPPSTQTDAGQQHLLRLVMYAYPLHELIQVSSRGLCGPSAA